MTILGIESSCDETAAAIITGEGSTVQLKANVVASSLAMHIATGGIIPEQAAREQVKYILPVIKSALAEAKMAMEDIDAFAVTYGPGLIGSLLVGVETTKTLSYVLQKPLVPINHMVGHIYANFINQNEIKFPLLALVVSGGHTDLLLMKKHGDFQLLGGTRDDAAGEAFDKIGRLLGLNYPAGPEIEKLAKSGDPKRFRFPRPMIGSHDYNFSFSGLKAAVLREVQTHKTLDEQTIKDIARATQDAISDVIVKKTLKAASVYDVKSILLSGGVAANQTLRDTFTTATEALPLTIFAPPKSLCTDNAAMIATAAFFNYKPEELGNVVANPELYFEATNDAENSYI
jgi:N6-L-threonylcarbamoyladenine synthase